MNTPVPWSARLALIVVALLLLASLIEQTGLTPADHGLGGLFGLARGVLLVLILVILAGHTDLPKEPWWEQAKLAERQRQAEEQVAQDPFVLSLIQDFDGSVKAGSIKATPLVRAA